MAKRPCTISPSQRFSPSTGLPAQPPPNGLPTHPPNGLPTHPPNGLPLPPNPQVGPQHYRLEDMALAHQYRDAYRHNEHRDARDRLRQTGRTTAFTLKIHISTVFSHMIRLCTGVYVSGLSVENKGQLSVQCDNPHGSSSI